ncbi:hypothetical protein MATL_G00236220 [Megalops atlanticus]|uniref:UPAR/Ly6 domain-containing protein n=1 Tax=Megalops atlanticus TaxID=7932 RepID=A0A9D3PH18_MEGAT|nr:hypothetical protein MATL_G00236220 [Megalops atlanticus]
METTHILLLAIAFGGLSVEALQCYSCTGTNSNTQCNQNTQNCSSLEDTCMTTVTTVLGIQSISKTCTLSTTCATASAGNINLVVGGNSVTCCATNLCNVNGFALTRLNLLLLGLPAALLALTLGTV